MMKNEMKYKKAVASDVGAVAGADRRGPHAAGASAGARGAHPAAHGPARGKPGPRQPTTSEELTMRIKYERGVNQRVMACAWGWSGLCSTS